MDKNTFDKKIDEVFEHEYIDGYGMIVAPKHRGWDFFDKLYEEFEKERSKAYEDGVRDGKASVKPSNFKYRGE